MRNSKSVLITLLFFSMLNYGANGQKLTKLYKEYLGSDPLSGAQSINYVEVQVFPSTNLIAFKPSITLRKIFLNDLSDRGQMTLIQELGKKTAKAEELNKHLSKPFIEPKSPVSPNKDYTKYIVHMELDVFDKHSSAVTNLGRISELLIRTKLQSTSEIEFYSFKDYNTVYEYVDFGDVEQTRVRNFSLNAGINIAGTGSTSNTTTGDTDSSEVGSSASQTSNLGGTFGSTRTTLERLKQQLRIISQMGSMADFEYFIFQQGAPKNNLEGKISLDLVIQTKNNITLDLFKFSGLYKDGAFQSDESKVKVSRYLGTYPKISSDIKADVSYKFEYRKIENEKGSKTKAENNDRIRIKYTDPSDLPQQTDVILATATSFDDFQKYWLLSDGANILYLEYQGRDYEIKFETMDHAMEVEQLLKSKRFLSVGGFKLKIGIPGAIADLVDGDIDNLTTTLKQF